MVAMLLRVYFRNGKIYYSKYIGSYMLYIADFIMDWRFFWKQTLGQ